MNKEIEKIPVLQEGGPVRPALKLLFGNRTNVAHHIDEMLDRCGVRKVLEVDPVAAVVKYALDIGSFEVGNYNWAQYTGSNEKISVPPYSIPQFLQMVYLDSGKAFPGRRFEIKASATGASIAKVPDIVVSTSLPFYERPPDTTHLLQSKQLDLL